MGNEFKPSVAKTFILMIVSIVKFIALPIRKPVFGVFLVLFLLGAPTFQGVPPAKVFSWYGEKLEPVTRRFVDYGNGWAKHTKPIRSSVSEAVGVVVDAAKQVKSGQGFDASKLGSVVGSPNKEQLAELKDMEDALRKSGQGDIADMARQMRGEKAPYSPNLENKTPYNEVKKTKAQLRGERNRKRFAALQKKRMPTAIKPQDSVLSKNDVKIIDEPIEKIIDEIDVVETKYKVGDVIKGKATFLSEDAVLINGQKVDFYGIYINKIDEAIDFMQSITGDDAVECKVIKVELGMPQGVCSAGGLEFNEMLVDAGMAEKSNL
jgi:hypothetical protein